MVLEARGLGVTPATVARFEASGDCRSAASDRIYRRIRHVGARTKSGQKRVRIPRIRGRSGVETVNKTSLQGGAQPSFNASARDEAGLSRDFYEGVASARDV
jgi:uncharacterized ferritin-like protein (DUF455 family)